MEQERRTQGCRNLHGTRTGCRTSYKHRIGTLLRDWNKADTSCEPGHLSRHNPNPPTSPSLHARSGERGFNCTRARKSKRACVVLRWCGCYMGAARAGVAARVGVPTRASVPARAGVHARVGVPARAGVSARVGAPARAANFVHTKEQMRSTISSVSEILPALRQYLPQSHSEPLQVNVRNKLPRANNAK